MSTNMADRDGFIWLDGKLLPWRDAKTHVLSHALHYGSAVLEGERSYDGRVFRLAAHSARLRNSARLLDYELPWSREEIDQATRAVVKANDLASGYVQRAIDAMPRQGSRQPWRLYQNYPRDIRMMRRGPLEDEAIAFSRAQTAAPSAEAVPA